MLRCCWTVVRPWHSVVLPRKWFAYTSVTLLVSLCRQSRKFSRESRVHYMEWGRIFRGKWCRTRVTLREKMKSWRAEGSSFQVMLRVSSHWTTGCFVTTTVLQPWVMLRNGVLWCLFFDMSMMALCFRENEIRSFLWLPLNCDVNTVQTTVVSSLFTMTFMSWVIHRPCSSLCQFVLGMLLCHKEVCKEHWKISQAKEEANEMKFFTAESWETLGIGDSWIGSPTTMKARNRLSFVLLSLTFLSLCKSNLLSSSFSS